MLVQEKKGERLLSIERSVVNLYQKMVTMEKENFAQKEGYRVCLEQLKMARKYEHKLIQELYFSLDLDKMLKLFNLENLKKTVNLESSIFHSEFLISYRLLHLIMDCYYEDTFYESVYDTKPSQLLNEKTYFANTNAVFLSFLQLIQKKIQMNFYRDQFSSLKHSLLFSFPFLEDKMMEGKIETLTNSHVELYFACRYGVPIKRSADDLKNKSELDIKRIIHDLTLHPYKPDFYLECMDLFLMAKLLNESAVSCDYFEIYISCLGNKSENFKRVLNLIREVKDLKYFQIHDSVTSNAYLRRLELLKEEES